MPITTTDSLSGKNKGQICHRCGKRVPLARWFDGAGWLCSGCDPRESVVVLAEDDRPVDRGRG